MKLFVFALLLALIAQIYADSNFISWESNSRERSSSYNVDRELNDLLSSATRTHSNWQSSAASMPEASWFITKVTQRLNNSSFLSGRDNLKNKLFKLADEKLEKCKYAYGLDRNCLGHASGHIMQLISAVENRSSHRRLVDTDY